jgi:PIN domain nuclease of toxin-antitoxin system
MPPTKVLDSFAVMAFFFDEKGAKTVEALLHEASEGKVDLVMSTVNLGEVWYLVARGMDSETADQYVQELQGMGIEIIPADWALTRQAAAYKARGNISYADCFAAALARIREGEIVTGDREFEALEGEVKVAWLK